MSNGNGNASISAAGFYADFGALTALKRDVKSGSDPQAIRAAAQQFESLFTDMMLKAMRAAKLGDGLGDSQQSDLYQDMYDEQLALQMSHGKGLGLADLLVQQLTRGHATSAATTAGSSAEASGGPRASSPGNAATSAGTAAGTSPAASGDAVSHARRISFLQMLEPYARRAGAALGISPDSLIAQAALETGWGQHVPNSPDAGSSHNLWGVKAGTTWLGQALQRATTEYRHGSALGEAQSFRAYSSLQQGVNDYVSLLQRSAAYRGALGTGNDVNAFAQALQRGGYATDPHYADKLVAAAAEVRALRAGHAAGGTGGVAAAGADAVPLKLSAELPITAGVDLARGAEEADEAAA